MIKERDVGQALPQGGFLRNYVRHACRRSDAPAAFHLGTGLGILAAVAPPALGLPWPPHTMRGNFWSLLVGPSGDRKSAAIDIGLGILREADGRVCADETPGSPEGLASMLREHPRRLIAYREFGQFLSQTEKGQARPIRESYCMLFDCLDDETEVLTEHGWRRRGQTHKGERIWTLNRATERMELAPVIAVTDRLVRPDERMLAYRTQRTDFRVTDRHEIHYKYNNQSKRCPSDWLTMPAADLHTRASPLLLPVAAEAAFPGIPLTDDELRFVAWFMTDSNWAPSKASRSAIEICQSKPDTTAEIRSLLLRLGMPFHERQKTNGASSFKPGTACTIFYVYRRGWAHLVQYMEKTVAPALHGMSREQFRTLWHEMLKGDGANTTNRTHPDHDVLWCGTAEKADAWQAMSVVRGFATCATPFQTKAHRTVYAVSSRDAQWIETRPEQNGRHTTLRKAKTGECVWCLTTRNGTLVTRRHGKVVILGNSPEQTTMTYRSKQVTIREPRLSLLAGCSPSYLARYSDPSDWEGGFLSRFLCMCAKQERNIPIPPMDWQDEATKLAASLRTLAATGADRIGRCVGFDLEAEQLWTEWYEHTQHMQVPERIHGALKRMQTVALKAALLYAFDLGISRVGKGSTWVLDRTVLEPAFALANLHLDGILAVCDHVAESEDMKDRQAVLRAVDGGAHTFGAILRQCRLLAKRCREILDTLVAEGTLDHWKAGSDGQQESWDVHKDA